MIAIKTGTTSWRAIRAAGELVVGEVAFNGSFIYSPDGFTPWMIWDAALGNVRAMTQAEINALPAQKQAARDAAEPDMVAARDQVVAAVANNNAAITANNTFIAIASPTTAQITAQVKALTTQMNASLNQRNLIMKAVARLVVREL